MSFYWTMDEGGGASRVDSTVGLAWPTKFGSLAAAGLFSNGIGLSRPLIINQNPGLEITTGAITINQATSTGISVWFWLKITDFGSAGSSGRYNMDTSDPMHTNRFRALWGFTDATTGSIEVGHTNDTDDVFADTPNLAWVLNSWHMVVITYNKTAQTLNIYIDGAISATAPDAFTYPDLTNTDMILDDTSFGSILETAVVDELGMCLGGVLTQAQITALYNGGAGVTWPNITPIVPYP